ncbi:MAG: hypothetical protein KA004_06410 [Verrucomicrobiales bacterium]|nr:hypothetical protein [Verrucomicrobiales bacterium]
MNSMTLPESLVAQMRSYERRLKRTETGLAVAGGLAGLFATYVVLFLVERWMGVPLVWRAGLLAVGALAAAWFAKGWARNWLWNRRGPAELAKILGRHFRSLSDRLQGVIELANATELPPNVSPALCRAAIAQVAQESAGHDFTKAIPTREPRRWAVAAAVVLGLMAVAFALVPKAATNTLQRWVLSNVDRYTFASLEQMDQTLYVAHGEPFEVALGLKRDSVWKPGMAAARIDRQEKLEVAFEDGKAVLKLPGQVQDGTLSLRVGDATRDIAIRPLHRPEMKQLVAKVEPPAYLGHPAFDQKVQGGLTELLEGSWVRFSGTIGRDVGTAEMEAPGMPRITKWNQATFLTAPRLADEIEGPVTLKWSDRHGLKPAQPYVLKVATTRDLEPKVEFKDLEPEVAILAHEVLKLNLAASDDYGIKETWVHWDVRPASGEEKKILATGELPRQPGAAQAKEVAATIDWSPLWHRIPEDTMVELTGNALDYFPGRKPSASWKHTIWVMSAAKHAEKLRERMDTVLKQLDDRIRDEERQLEENKEISERKENEPTEKTAEDIRKVEAGERQNEDQLQKLAQEMEGVMKDALRNKEVPESTLGEWQDLQKKLQQEASPEMQQAAQKMQQAADSPQQEQRQQEMAKAMDSQQKALDAMKEAANKMNEVNENMYARNFYNRLRQAAQNEMSVSERLKKLAKDTAGLRAAEIQEAHRKDFQGVAGTQDSNTLEVEGIYHDMGAFVTRVPNEKYQAVHKEMEEKKVVGALGELASFVRDNLGLKSVGQAKLWGKQLEDWAAMLQDESQGGGSGGGGEIPPEVMKLMIGMVRAAQAQDTIREQTESLENRQWTSRRYGEDVSKVADLQAELAGTINKLKTETPVEEAKPLLGEVEKLMKGVSMELRSPKTDKDTVATQGAIIELLVPPDKKSSSSSSQMMAKMQQQMQQMMAKASKPGRNNGKYASNLSGETAQGPAVKDKANARSVDKSGGAASAGEWPEEFKDQLQAYFQNLEAGKK